MPRPFAIADPALTRFTRRLVLGTAFLVGLAFALAPRTATVHAQEARTPPAAAAAASKDASTTKPATVSDGHGLEARADGKDARDAAPKAGPSPGSAADAAAAEGPPTAADGKSGSGRRAVIIGEHGRIRIDGLGTDREFDSVGEFVHDEPAIATMVIAVVTVVFLAPVLLIALVLWYRMRKARMLNETMLQLAEKGVVTSAEALEALAGGKQAAALATGAATAPIYEQAKQIRRRAAWSDLRKGVFTGGVGLALTLYSLFDDRSPNGLGLVLLFVGLGFIVLWWFEERQLAPTVGAAARGGPTNAASGAPPGGAPPSA